jgi:hypothetical protein
VLSAWGAAMINNSLSSVRRTQYRMYDLQTRVTGLTAPFICGFTLVPLGGPEGEHIVRMCVGRHSSIDDAHAVAQLVGEKTVDLMLARAHLTDRVHLMHTPA